MRWLKLWLRGYELRVYAFFRAWETYNLAAGLDFLHHCPKCTRNYSPIDFTQCPRCRITTGIEVRKGRKGINRAVIEQRLQRLWKKIYGKGKPHL